MRNVIDPRALSKGKTPQALGAGTTEPEKHAKSPDFLDGRNSHREEIPPLELTLHPILETFPEMTETEFRRLTSSILENGILVPLLINRNRQILDGRSRWMVACKNLPTVPVMVLDDANELSIAISTALDRRQLSTSGRALIVFLRHPEVANEPAMRKLHGLYNQERDRAEGAPPKDGDLTFEALAARYSVSRKYLSYLAKIKMLCENEDEWKDHQQKILNGGKKSSIEARLVAALGAKGTKGGAPKEEWFNLAVKCLKADLVTRLSRYPEFTAAHKREAVNIFCHALTEIPPQFLEAVEERLPELLTKTKGKRVS